MERPPHFDASADDDEPSGMDFLLGSTKPSGYAGDKNRLSYRQAEQLREGVIADLSPHARDVEQPWRPGDPAWMKGQVIRQTFPPAEIATQYGSYMDRSIGSLASGELRGQAVCAFDVVSRVLSSGWYTDPDEGERHVSVGDKTLRQKAEVAHQFATAVAVLEGCFAPNDLGYVFDRTISLARKAEVAGESLHRALDVIEVKPKLFGSRTVSMANAISLRADLHRPVFGGIPLGQPFPRLDRSLEDDGVIEGNFEEHRPRGVPALPGVSEASPGQVQGSHGDGFRDMIERLRRRYKL